MEPYTEALVNNIETVHKRAVRFCYNYDKEFTLGATNLQKNKKLSPLFFMASRRGVMPVCKTCFARVRFFLIFSFNIIILHLN